MAFCVVDIVFSPLCGLAIRRPLLFGMGKGCVARGVAQRQKRARNGSLSGYQKRGKAVFFLPC